MKKIQTIITGIIIACIMNFFLFNLFYVDLKGKTEYSIFIYFLISLLLMTIGFYMFRYTISRLKVMDKKSVIILILASLLFSTLLIISVPIKHLSLAQNTSLEIKVLGEKNASSSGNEVWVNGLYIDDNKVDWNNVAFSEGWILKDNIVPFSYQNGETIKWEGKIKKNIKIEFVNHAWSGKVEVFTNGKSEIVDLYNSEGITNKFQYDVNPSYIFIMFSYLIDIIALSQMFFVLFLILERYSIISKVEYVNRKRILFYVIPILTVYSIYFISFYPANMSPDSMDQWAQTHGGVFNNWHPTYHTLLLWIFYSIWSSPAIVSIFQILFMSLTFGYILYYLEKLGLDRRLCLLLMIIIAFNPVNGMMSITLWKDIPFAVMSLILVVMLFKVYKSNYAWFYVKRNLIFFVFVLINVGLLRHNGIVTVIGVSIVLLALYLKQFKKNILIISIVFISIILVKGPIFQLLNVVPAPPHFTLAFQLHQVGTMLHKNVQLDSNAKKYFEEILPIEKWKGEDNVYVYSKYSANYLLFHPSMNPQNIIDDKILFIKNWMMLVISNPSIAFDDWRSITSLVWRISQPPDGYLYTVPREIITNDFGLIQTNVIPDFKNSILKIVNATEKHNINWLFWRPAMFLFIILLFGFVFMNRNKDLKAIIVISPVLFEAAGLLISTPAQDARYFYSVTLIAPIIIGLSFIKIRKCKNDEILR